MCIYTVFLIFYYIMINCSFIVFFFSLVFIFLDNIYNEDTLTPVHGILSLTIIKYCIIIK